MATLVKSLKVLFIEKFKFFKENHFYHIKQASGNLALYWVNFVYLNKIHLLKCSLYYWQKKQLM